MAGNAHASLAQPVFYYDLGNPRCYLVAEQISAALPAVPEWVPVLAARLPGSPPRLDRRSFEHDAKLAQLQPVRWPERWPPDTLTVTLAATYAKQIGRAVAFSLAAFRQAFAAGRDLGEQETVLIAGAACEMHPTALLKGIGLRSTVSGLERASVRALDAGVRTVPAVEIEGQVLEGNEVLERIAAAR